MDADKIKNRRVREAPGVAGKTCIHCSQKVTSQVMGVGPVLVVIGSLSLVYKSKGLRVKQCESKPAVHRRLQIFLVYKSESLVAQI